MIWYCKPLWIVCNKTRSLNSAPYIQKEGGGSIKYNFGLRTDYQLANTPPENAASVMSALSQQGKLMVCHVNRSRRWEPWMIRICCKRKVTLYNDIPEYHICVLYDCVCNNGNNIYIYIYIYWNNTNICWNTNYILEYQLYIYNGSIIPTIYKWIYI